MSFVHFELSFIHSFVRPNINTLTMHKVFVPFTFINASILKFIYAKSMSLSIKIIPFKLIFIVEIKTGSFLLSFFPISLTMSICFILKSLQTIYLGILLNSFEYILVKRRFIIIRRGTIFKSIEFSRQSLRISFIHLFFFELLFPREVCRIIRKSLYLIRTFHN